MNALRKKKRSLHVMVDAEIYEKLRYICFYERVTLAEVLRRLLLEFLEDRETRRPDLSIPRQL